MLTPKLAVAALAGLLVIGMLTTNWDRFLSITHLDELFGIEAISDPVRILERLAKLERERIDLDRRITDLTSARRAAKRRAEIVLQMQALVVRFAVLPVIGVNETPMRSRATSCAPVDWPGACRKERKR